MLNTRIEDRSLMHQYILLNISLLIVVGIPTQAADAIIYRSVDELQSEVLEKLELSNPYIADTAMNIASDYPGEYNINQVTEIYDSLFKGWYYYSDPSDRDYFQSANLTLLRGKIDDTIGRGDCDDFAILMASLIESIGGSARITFAYDALDKSSHSYTEVYLGKEGEPQVDELLRWLREEYSLMDIPGINTTYNEVWLNLDWSAGYPGGTYFGNESHRVQRGIIWASEIKTTPRILPVIDTMDNIGGWQRRIEGNKGSTLQISTVPGKKGKGLQLIYYINENGSVIISKEIDPKVLSRSTGISISYFSMSKHVILEERLVYTDGTTFSALCDNIAAGSWESPKILYEDFKCINSADGSLHNEVALNASKVKKVEFIISNNPMDSFSSGTIIFDDLRGSMAISVGSPWAREEEERKQALANQLALEADRLSQSPSMMLESVQRAIESIRLKHTLIGDLVLRRSLLLLPVPVARMNHNGSVTHIEFSHDGRRIVTASFDNTARVWNASSGLEIARMVHDNHVISAAFSPDDSKIVSASYDGTARVWDASSGKELSRMTHDRDVNSVAFSPDGSKIASACIDGTIKVWDASSEKEFSRISHNNRTVNSIIFSPDGSKIASASYDGTVRIWNTSSGEELARMAHDYPVYAITFSPDGHRIASASFDMTARVWNVSSGVEITRMEHDSGVLAVAFSPDGNRVSSGGFDGILKVWDATSGAMIANSRHWGFIDAIIFSPDGSKVASASRDGTACIWDAYSGEELFRLDQERGVFSIAFSPDGKRIAAGSEDHIAMIWNISPENNNNDNSWKERTGMDIALLKPHSPIRNTFFNPFLGMLAIAGEGNIAKVLNCSSGEELFEVRHDTQINAIALSSDGRKIATASDGTVTIWDVASGKEEINITSNGYVSDVSFSPDGKKLATASNDYTARIWNAYTGEELAKMVHDNWVVSVAFSPDGSKLATASTYNTPRIWNTATGQELMRMAEGRGSDSVAFSSDGYNLIAERWGSMYIWPLRTEDLLCQACSRLKCNLTSQDWWRKNCGNCTIRRESL